MSATHAPARGVLMSCTCALALGALAACGGSTGTSDSTGSPGAASASSAGTASAPSAPATGATTSAVGAAVIRIKDFGFTTPSSVSPGAAVEVHNEDSVAHTVTANSGHAFDDAASPGNSSFTAPMTAGSYPFHCNIHPEMHGVLVVG